MYILVLIYVKQFARTFINILKDLLQMCTYMVCLRTAPYAPIICCMLDTLLLLLMKIILYNMSSFFRIVNTFMARIVQHRFCVHLLLIENWTQLYYFHQLIFAPSGCCCEESIKVIRLHKKAKKSSSFLQKPLRGTTELEDCKWFDFTSHLASFLKCCFVHS